MPDVKFHGSIGENSSNCIADVTAVVGDKYFRQRDVKCIASCLEAIKKLAYLSVRLAVTKRYICM
jgi:hypothetical protein